MRYLGLFLALLAAAGACAPDLQTTGGAGGASSSTSGPGGNGGASSSSGSGGSGTPCTSNDDCKGVVVPICHVTACEAGACIIKPMGSTADQKPDSVGDCLKYLCNPEGELVPTNDPNDPPRDAYECTVEKCGGSTTTAPSCTLADGGTGFCDPVNVGKCVACGATTPCGGTDQCFGGACQPLTCTNDITDTGETGIDCGGPCPPCAVTVGCSEDADCGSRNCVSNKCDIPSCTNGKMDGQESDVDCGGPQCESCTPAHACRGNEDCTTNKCHDGICKTLTCFDNQKNNDEAGVDCGGSCPFACP